MKRSNDLNLYRGIRVLIVEDSWPVARALTSVLDDMGMAVLGPANTIAEAERLAVERKPDLALVDLKLRGEMAYGLVDWLRERGVRVIVLTGSAAFNDRSLKTADAVLQKPYGGQELLATMQEVMLALHSDRSTDRIE